jgi:hypothetical protein
VLRKIFGLKKDDVTGGRRKLPNKVLHYLCFLPSIIEIFKSRLMRWAGHVAIMGIREMCIGYSWDGQKERDY